jgi:hypothetical protein
MFHGTSSLVGLRSAQSNDVFQTSPCSFACLSVDLSDHLLSVSLAELNRCALLAPRQKRTKHQIGPSFMPNAVAKVIIPVERMGLKVADRFRIKRYAKKAAEAHNPSPRFASRTM